MLTTIMSLLRNLRITGAYLSIIFITVTYFTILRQADAQDKGVGLFAIMSPSFPCEKALLLIPKEGKVPSLSLLWGTFGSDTKCLSQWIEHAGNRPHLVEIHLSNEPCRRNKRCESTEFLFGISSKDLSGKLEKKEQSIVNAYTERVKEIASTLKPFIKSKGEYILSTGLEDNFSDKAYDTVVSIIQKNWSGTIVRNPEKDSSYFKGAHYLELHGNKPLFPTDTPCIANLDGVDMAFPNHPARTKQKITWEESKDFLLTSSAHCRSTFLWAAPWQGIVNDSFIPPRSRKWYLETDDIEAVSALMK